MSEALVAAAAKAARPLSNGRSPRGAGIGHVATALPPTIVPNAVIGARLGVSDDWIVARTGVRERRIAAPEETLAALATDAGRSTLESAGLDPAELDLVLVATTTQDHLTPNTAPLVAAALGASGAGALDVGAACTAFLGALALGAAQIEAGRAGNVLVIGADFLTRFVDHDDRRTAALFGDGAGAILMTATEPPGHFGPFIMRSDGAQVDLIYAERGDAVIRMRGSDTFKHAVNRLAEVTVEALAAAELAIDDIDLFVYHQANSRILLAVGERLGLPPERVVDCVAKYGNTSAASLPLALASADAEGRLTDGTRVLLSAFGAGFTWGGVVLEWGTGG